MRRSSAVILAGGYSSRMGQNKAELDFHGVSFLQHQVNKLRAIGIEDIVIAGYPNVPDGCRYVSDIYPHRGPLSGIHAGLLAVEEPRALVLAVDTPLVPETLLEELLANHSGRITVVSRKGEIEPLIGVYDRTLFEDCEKILRGTNCSVRELFRKAGFSRWEYTGDPRLLMNANTPEEYKELIALSP